MQQQLRLSFNYLVLTLMFFSIGGGLAHASDLPEIRKEQPLSSEKFSAANAISVAFRENPVQEIPELLNEYYSGNSSVVPVPSLEPLVVSSEEIHFSFKRDLRKDLKIQLFPKHFFL